VNWQALVDELKPWHYCHQFPDGVVTGDSTPDWNEKLELLTSLGAYPKDEYPQVLDLGSNSGLFAMWFADNKGSHVVAVENSGQFPLAYKQLCLAVHAKGYVNQITPWMHDIREGDFGRRQFDLVNFLGTLHHIGAGFHTGVFANCFEALKPGGEIVVQTREDMMVPAKLRAAGFRTVAQLPNYRQQERLAWTAIKPPLS
jgi:SAM-dependent methyltransferase